MYSSSTGCAWADTVITATSGGVSISAHAYYANGGNLTIGGNVSATGPSLSPSLGDVNLYASAGSSSVANVTGGNIDVTGNVTATGAISLDANVGAGTTIGPFLTFGYVAGKAIARRNV